MCRRKTSSPTRHREGCRVHLDAQGGQRYEGALGAQLTVSFNVCQKNERSYVCGMLAAPSRDAHRTGREQGGESSQSLFFSSVEESLIEGGHMWLFNYPVFSKKSGVRRTQKPSEVQLTNCAHRQACWMGSALGVIGGPQRESRIWDSMVNHLTCTTPTGSDDCARMAYGVSDDKKKACRKAAIKNTQIVSS